MTKAFISSLLSAVALSAMACRADESVLTDANDPPFMYVANGAALGVYTALVIEAFRRAGIDAQG